MRGRWVDVNEGDTTHPEYSTMSVGKEFNTGVGPTLCVAPPTLEALEMLLTEAATDQTRRLHVMLSYVNRDNFNTVVNRKIHLHLPDTYLGYQAGWVGQLRLALYGTPRHRAALAGMSIATSHWRGI